MSQKYTVEIEVFDSGDAYLDLWDGLDSIDRDIVYTIIERLEDYNAG